MLLRAAAAGKRERLRDGKAIDDAGRTLARACSVLLDDTIAEPLRDAVFAAVEHERLATAVNAIERLTRSPDDRAQELVTRSYPGVRRYLPLLLDTIAFHATDGGEPILEALTALKLSEMSQLEPGPAMLSRRQASSPRGPQDARHAAERVGEAAQARVRDVFLGPRHLGQYVALLERVLAAA